MKILLIFLTFLVIHPIPVSAQTSIGAMVGGVVTGAKSSSPPHEAKENGSYVIGGIINHRLDSIWSFQIQPAYIIKGATMYYPFFLPEAERITPSWSYAELGIFIMGEYNLGSMSIGGLAGITPSLLLDGETTIDVWNPDAGEYGSGASVDIKDRMFPFDLAFTFGVSVRYPVTEGVDILGEARRSVGVIEVIEQGGGSYLSRDDRIQIGVMIEL